MRCSVVVSLLVLGVAGAGCATREASRSQARLAPAPAKAPASVAPTLDRGSRGTESVGTFVRARQSQLQFCHDEARAKRPGLGGTVTVSITLDDAGTVRDAAVVRRSWAGDGRPVEKCMLAAVRRWRFPALSPNDEHVHSFSVIFSADPAPTPDSRDR